MSLPPLAPWLAVWLAANTAEHGASRLATSPPRSDPRHDPRWGRSRSHPRRSALAAEPGRDALADFARWLGGSAEMPRLVVFGLVVLAIPYFIAGAMWLAQRAQRTPSRLDDVEAFRREFKRITTNLFALIERHGVHDEAFTFAEDDAGYRQGRDLVESLYDSVSDLVIAFLKQDNQPLAELYRVTAPGAQPGETPEWPLREVWDERTLRGALDALGAPPLDVLHRALNERDAATDRFVAWVARREGKGG
jgi:hypothetical protein